MDWFRKRTLGELPGEAARRWGDREALLFEGRRWTYAEFAAEVDRVAKGLIGLGVEPGEHVGIWMTNRPEWLFLMFAIPKVGAVTVGLNTRYRADDVAYTVDQSDTTTLIGMDRSGPVDYRSMLAEALPRLPKLRRLVMWGDDPLPSAVDWDALLAAGEGVGDEELAARLAGVDPDARSLIITPRARPASPRGPSTATSGCATWPSGRSCWATAATTCTSATCRCSTPSAIRRWRR